MPPRKKKIEKKIEELEKSLGEAKAKADNYLNQLKYAKADLENVKKQNKRDLERIIERANGKLLEKLLPILDDLELFLISNSVDGKTVQGIKMVYKKLENLLESEGCKPIISIGNPFDPFRHEAVIEVDSDEIPNGHILEEIRKGYTYKDRVLRASMVKVARNSIKVNKD